MQRSDLVCVASLAALATPHGFSRPRREGLSPYCRGLWGALAAAREGNHSAVLGCPRKWYMLGKRNGASEQHARWITLKTCFAELLKIELSSYVTPKRCRQ